MSDMEMPVISSAAEAGKLLKSLLATRRGKLGACTRKMNDIKALLIENGAVNKIELLIKDLVRLEKKNGTIGNKGTD